MTQLIFYDLAAVLWVDFWEAPPSQTSLWDCSEVPPSAESATSPGTGLKPFGTWGSRFPRYA